MGGACGAAAAVAPAVDAAVAVVAEKVVVDETHTGAACAAPLQRENDLRKEGYAVVAGTDEAGRGPLAGPVVAAAFEVLAPEDLDVIALLGEVTDSKQMTPEDRETAFGRLTGAEFVGRVAWAISEIDSVQIDEMNILQASLASMAEAVRALTVRPDCVLVDGCNRPPDLLRAGECWTRGNRKLKEAADDVAQSKLTKFFGACPKPSSQEAEGAPAEEEDPGEAEGTEGLGKDPVPMRWRPRMVEAVVNGDAQVASIAAASVLAKVHRDRVMARLHTEFPAYGFDVHKGYATAAHIAAIREHGVCAQHRRSFEPIRSMIEAEATPSPKPKASFFNEGRRAGALCDTAGGSGDGPTPEATPQKRRVAAPRPARALPPEPPAAGGTSRKPSVAAPHDKPEGANPPPLVAAAPVTKKKRPAAVIGGQRKKAIKKTVKNLMAACAGKW